MLRLPAPEGTGATEISRSEGGYRVGDEVIDLTEGLIDEGSWQPIEDGLASRDPLGFPGYQAALSAAKEKAEADESVRAGAATIGRYKVELACFEFAFIGGSMGEVSGERLARAMERAAERGVPFVLRTATGGARMQEGMRSLIQMPKVVAARIALGYAKQPFIAIFGNPTTGGVLASLGALADVIVAEAGATVGFAGPRVAERFMGKPLSEDSHVAESALSFGLVDEVVDPEELKEYIATILLTLAPDQPRELEPPVEALGMRDADAWDTVQAARSGERELNHQLLLEAVDTMIVLRGDRAGAEDPSLDVALARIAGRRALILALDRERSPGPAAYRKARRAIRTAERLGIPIVTLIDTRGADPSEDSESGGIAWEIARLFEAMLTVPVPTLGIVTGEGGSGGALAFGATDLLYAYELSFFSVIGPELAAEILWRAPDRAEEAARMLKLTAHDLVDLGIADGLLPEPLDSQSLRSAIAYHLARLEESYGAGDPSPQRRDRWRNTYGDR